MKMILDFSKKYLFIIFIIVAILITCVTYREYKSYTLIDFVKKDKIDELTLTITCLDPDVTVMSPLNADELLNSYSDLCERVIVRGNDLNNIKELLYKLGSYHPQQQTNNEKMSAEIHYAFTTKFGITVLEVILWSCDGNIYVNKTECAYDDVYCEILLPFVPDDVRDYLIFHMRGE